MRLVEEANRNMLCGKYIIPMVENPRLPRGRAVLATFDPLNRKGQIPNEIPIRVEIIELYDVRPGSFPEAAACQA